MNQTTIPAGMNKEEFYATLKVGDKLVIDDSMIGSGRLLEVEVVEKVGWLEMRVKRNDGQLFRNGKDTRKIDMSWIN